MAGAPFVPFGAAHAGALAAAGVLSFCLPWIVRRRPDTAPGVRIGLAGGLLGGVGAFLIGASREGPLSVWDVLPLHLCDFAIFLALYALLTLRPIACELLYFWAGSGTLLAMLTPDLAWGFPDWRFLVYFGLHGGVVAAAATLAFGAGVGPRPGGVRRALLLTNAYAAAVGVVDAASGMNFLYLRSKPEAPTLLDWLGPWPLYLAACEGLALVLFTLLALPFRSGRR